MVFAIAGIVFEARAAIGTGELADGVSTMATLGSYATCWSRIHANYFHRLYRTISKLGLGAERWPIDQ